MMNFKIIIKFLILFAISSTFCNGQIIQNSSFEGPQTESISPPGWFSCNSFSTPDTQPGTWMVDQSASHGNTYISLVTRGANNEINDGYTEAISTRLIENLTHNTCYTLSLDLAYFSRFDDGLTVRQGTWRPVKLNIWASNAECAKTTLLWKSEVVSNEDWQVHSFNFVADQEYSFLILEADYAEPDIHNGNILIDNIQISKSQLNINDANLCIGEKANFSVDFPGAAVEWNTGSTEANMETNKGGIYWVKVTTGNCVLTDTFKVTYPEPLQIELGENASICLQDSLILDVSNAKGNYVWSTGSTESKITVKEPGFYRVMVDNGCEYVEDEIEVSLLEQCCLISAPNVFTPNNDQINDYFEISSRSVIGKFNLKILNRWGKIVYESDNLDQFWNGFSKNGKEASTGLYYWNISVFCIRGLEIEENFFRGTLTLVR